MKYEIVTAPTEDALNFDEVKNYLRIPAESSIDDSMITNIILASYDAFEGYTNLVLRQTIFDYYWDGFPRYGYKWLIPGRYLYAYDLHVKYQDDFGYDHRSLVLPGPLKSVTSIKYTDENSVQQTIASSQYVVTPTISVPYPDWGRITLAYGCVWPVTLYQADTVVVRFTSGWTQSAIPARILQGLMLCCRELYDGTDESEAYKRCWDPWRKIAI